MLLVLGVFVFAVTLLVHRLLSKRRARSLPPGPTPSFIIGNALQIPRTEPWVWCGTSMKEQYGEISYLSVFGQPMIILNSLEAINEIFLKRSAIYSDRPKSIIAGEIMGVDQSTTLAPYGPVWRTHRRLWHDYMGAKSVQDSTSLFQTESRALVLRLLNSKDDTFTVLRLSVVKLLLGFTYGMDVSSLADDFVARTDRSTRDIVETFTPGKYLVDALPLLKYVPTWFPGAGWKRFGLQLRDRLDRMIDEPYEYVKESLASSNSPHRSSFAQGMIENPLGDEHTQKWVAGTVYGGGAETLHSAMNRFMVAMMLYPDVQRKAQQEIQDVVGSQRLPDVSDKGSLPYLNALIRELLRWNIIAPFGIPHCSVEDDEYHGYHIPQGSIILANYWTISQDVNIYPDPDVFRPERFLSNSSNDADYVAPIDPWTYAFGIGRRSCPGRHFAQTALYEMIVTVLATCNISRPLDKNGQPFDPVIKYSGLSLREMEPFSVLVEPRSDEAITRLRDSMVV